MSCLSRRQQSNLNPLSQTKNSKTSVIERSGASLSSRHRNRKKRPSQSRDRADENIRAGEERRRSNGGRGDKNKESDRP